MILTNPLIDPKKYLLILTLKYLVGTHTRISGEFIGDGSLTQIN